MTYTVVIRTLGKAGDKFQKELDSICAQTIQPEEIIVYIAEGYPIPKETCGKERYVHVKKGMVAQRALQYTEVKTDWILFLDDDVFLPANAVEILFNHIMENGADVVSPNTFENHKMGWKTRLMNWILAKAVPFKSDKWAYKVLRSGGFGYNSNPTKDFYWSETNAGPCFLCRKKDFLKIHFEEEIWLDDAPYALPEDQVMFYKMHLNGLKVATIFNSGIVHLDAGTAVNTSSDRNRKMLYSEYRNQIIFWHKFIQPYQNGFGVIISKLLLGYYKYMRKLLALKSVFKNDYEPLETLREADKSILSHLENATE